MNAMGRFFHGTAAERRLIMSAAVAVVRAWLALRLSPGRVLRRLNQAAETPVSERPSPVEGPNPEQIAWAVRGVSRYVPRSTCLVQALAAQSLLSHAGHPCRVRIGLRRDLNADLRGHAWVESAGRVVIGDCPELSQYVDMVGDPAP